MRVCINIGLGNNPIPADEIATTLKVLFGHRTLFRIDSNGSWENTGAEQTLVVLIETDPNWTYIKLNDLFRNMCINTTQEAIAFYVYDTSYGHLSFNPYYKGKRYDFDMKYFIEY